MSLGIPMSRTRNRYIMQYTTLGHSGIKVSKLCLGGMSFGEASPDFHQWTIGPDDTRAVIKRALDLTLSPAEVDFLEELYQPHALVGPKSRPGEKPLAGTTNVKTSR